ncbi:MAG: BREX system ATP-binding domain-containing protein [Anaerolineae bacterium]
MSLTLSLLGPFSATLNGREIGGFESDKVRALLVYLAVEGERPQRRERLAGLLWPERPDSVALGNLRAALAGLRGAMGDREASPAYLHISRDSIGFNLSSDHELDVRTFERLLEATQEQADVAARLEQAVALYRGSFMEGFSLADAPEYEQWLLIRRERLERQALSAMGRLAAQHEGAGRYEEGLALAWRQLELAPWEEGAHQQLMRLLALSGQRSAALAHYGRCRQVLADELGTEPGPETVALYETMRKAAPVVTALTGQPEPVLPPPEAPSDSGEGEKREPQRLFVGRERELEKLDRLLGRALGGQGQVAFVVGEPGSGKTQLLLEFARQAMEANQDLVAGFGSCNAYTGVGDPYLPFIDITRACVGDLDAIQSGRVISPEHARRLQALAGPTAQALVERGPDLITSFVPAAGVLARVQTAVPEGGAWPARLAELARRREDAPASGVPQAALLEQYARVLQAVAEKRPLLLTVDDLQWADQGSLNLLFHLGRRLCGSRVLLVGAYRPAEVAQGRDGKRHPLEAVANELVGAYGDVLVDLDRAEGQQFVEALIDSEPNLLGPAFRRELHHRTGGNALFATELLRGLRERGGVVRDDAGRWGARPDVDWEHVPVRVEAAIGESVGRMPGTLRKLLAAASVQGEEFVAEVAALAQGMEGERARQALSGPLSQRHRMVAAQGVERLGGESLSRYRFRHYLFQSYLYRRLDPVERVRLHEATGIELERLHEGHEGEVAVDLARHFEEAGLAGKAVEYLRLAAKRAARLAAHDEAASLLRRACSLLSALPGSPERDRQELALLTELTLSLDYSSGFLAPETVSVDDRADELAAALGDDLRRRMRRCRHIGLMHSRAAYWEALRVSREEFPESEIAGDPVLTFMCHFQRGINLHHLGLPAAALEHFEAARSLVAAAQTKTSLMALPLEADGAAPGFFVAVCLWRLGYPDRAWAAVTAALQDAIAKGNLELIHHFLVIVLALGDQMGYGREVTREQTEFVLRLIPARERAESDGPLLVWAQGEPGEQEKAARGWYGLIAGRAATGVLVDRTFHLQQLAQNLVALGRNDEALTVLDEALDRARNGDERIWDSVNLCLKGRLLLQRGGDGDAEAAESCFRDAVALAREQEARSDELRATTGLARILAGQGRRDEAREMLAAVYGWFTEGFDTADLREARSLLDELA